MPNLKTLLEHNDPNIIVWRTGKEGDEYVPRADSLPVINNIITLLEIPSESEGVKISGFTEVKQDLYKKKAYLDTNEFIVNYSNGVVMVHPSHEGKTLLCAYKGRGKILYPASRIYAMIKRNPDIVVTLQDYIDGLREYTLNLDAKLIEINNAIQNAIQATSDANVATDNANLAANNAIQAAEEANRAAASSIVIHKDPVDMYEELEIVYPDPENGWQVTINTTGDIYRYDGVFTNTWQWVGNYIGTVPYVSELSDGILTKEDYSNFIIRSVIFQFPRILDLGVQSAMVQFPFDGEIVKAYAFCTQGGITAPLELAVEKISDEDYDSDGAWDNIFSTNLFIEPNEKKSTIPVIEDTAVTSGDYFRISVLQLDNNIKGVTIQVDIKI